MPLDGLAQDFVNIGLACQAITKTTFILVGKRHVFHGHGKVNVAYRFFDWSIHCLLLAQAQKGHTLQQLLHAYCLLEIPRLL